MAPLRPITSSILYLGSLPYDWNETIVKSVVANSGNVVDVRLSFDYEGKNKGFCFVEYQSTRDALKAAPLLSQIVIIQPNGNTKRLRVEGSKEGYKSNNTPSELKPLINAAHLNIPSNVRLPPEMMSGSRNNSPMPPNVSIHQRNMTPPMQRHMTPPQQQNFNPNINNNNNLSTIGRGAIQPMPTKLTQASKTYPYAASLPLSTPDKINETLSIIPPIQLIELIANMKNTIQTDINKAQNFFQTNPSFALCAVQVLSLMGFVDDDVIKESMESISSSSTPQQQYQQPQQQYQQPQQQYQQYQQGQPQYQQGQQQYQGFNNINTYTGNNNNNSPYSRHQQPITGSKWPQFPQETQQKLMALPPDQAEKTAQILSLGESNLKNLAQEAKYRIQSLRTQYGLPRFNNI
ncbi:uncharacterized protein KGF55_003860 [Candida pseudojiufengensis]|uniref:uncharacterized protein n=1 Tax=Candida pseudojiufengensis TaxID=497109 RepID=UPI0022241ADF|nr:uncharacterized protein KGF55_003860 [Candida pseudojiufengensis]KAI5961889.1 hypothetical protein KGF55_003860 [Candida pseudojiufengensis]